VGNSFIPTAVPQRTVLCGVHGSYLEDGSVDKIFLWDPAAAGQAQLKLALRLINGRRVGPA
jgi:hypothetical protein